MIDNDANKLIRPIAIDIVSEILIWLVVHEDIRYFSYKMRIFVTDHKERSCSKAFEQIQASHPTEYSLVLLR